MHRDISEKGSGHAPDHENLRSPRSIPCHPRRYRHHRGSRPLLRGTPRASSTTVRATTHGHGEVATSIADAILKDGTDSVAPQGVNDWSCTPSPTKPNPVILIHGMSMTANTAWAGFGPVLKDQGYCVYAVNMAKDRDGAMSKVVRAIGDLDFGGLADIEASATFTAAFINDVMKTTGAKKSTSSATPKAAPLPTSSLTPTAQLYRQHRDPGRY
ncbi:MAG: hypothetical protein U1U88_001687 [Lawsonella clevelandensis]